MVVRQREDQLADLVCWTLRFRLERELVLSNDPHYLLLAALNRAFKRASQANPALISPGLARRLHDGTPKSFALAPLLVTDDSGIGRDPVHRFRALAAGATLATRICGLDGATCRSIALALSRWRAGAEIELDNANAVLTASERIAVAVGGRPLPDTYADLLTAAQPAERIDLRLVSPLAIRSSGVSLRPDQLAVRHFVGEYAQRWNALAPIDVDRAPADALLAGVAFAVPPELERVPRPSWTSKAPAPAYIGTVRLTVADDPIVRRWAAALADYAVYAGTGSATAWGYGQTRRIS